MKKSGKIDFHLTLKLIGATLSSIGFYLVAFDRKITGAIFIGLGGVIMAIGGS